MTARETAIGTDRSDRMGQGVPSDGARGPVIEGPVALTGAVAIRRNGPLAELTLNAPPRNLLTAKLRQALGEALAAMIADPGISGIVLRGAGGNFSAGLALADVDKAASPTVADLCRLIEGSPKCVLVAIEGTALGAGLELALAAHYRLSAPDARLGLPEVTVGLSPSAGATQRLPRLIGAGDALRLLLGGGEIGAAEAVALGLVDRVVGQGLGAEAADTALTLPVRPTGELTVGLRDAVAFRVAISKAHAESGSAGRAIGVPAGILDRITDCVEAAQLLPLSQGLAYEAAVHDELAASPDAVGLLHAQRAAALAALLPSGLAGRSAPSLRRIGLQGAGRLGLAVAAQALTRGLEVVLVDPRRDTLVAGLKTVAALLQAEVDAGRLTAEACDADWARLTPALDPDALAGADLVLAEAEAGEQVPGAVLLGALPQRGAGLALHPAHMAQGIAELALSGTVSAASTLAALALTRRLGWGLAVTGPGGTIEQRLRQVLAAAIRAEERAGHSPAVIAAALAGFGIGLGDGTAAPAGLPAGAGAGGEGQAVLQHCLLALANEGARMLGEGLARRPAVIDAVAVGSRLFPRHRGGPMFQADRRGILVVQAALAAAADAVPDPTLWQPAPLIGELLRRGRDFGAMNG